MPEEPPEYLSYLLRVWRVSGEEETWRASLESPLTHEFRGFGSLDELFDFLRRRTSSQPDIEREESETMDS